MSRKCDFKVENCCESYSRKTGYKNKDVQKALIDHLTKKFKIKKLEDWYNVYGEEFPIALLLLFGVSHANFLKSYFNYDFKEWLFKKQNKGFWKDKKNHKRYLDWFIEKHNIVEINDLLNHQINFPNILKKEYGGAVKMLKYNFPDYEWMEWKMKFVPPGFWNEKENRIRYLKWLEKELGFKKPEDWYNVKYTDFLENFGVTLISKFYNSLYSEMTKELYPEYDWLEWEFIRITQNFWKNKNNRILYLKWLGYKLNFKCEEDWYKINRNDFKNNKGISLFGFYNFSPREVCKELYPKFEWMEWKFKNVPKNFWKSKENKLRYINFLGKKLNYNKMEDWYNIGQKDFNMNYGGGLLTGEYGGCSYKAIINIFDDHKWLFWKFKKTSKIFWKDDNNCFIYLNWLKKNNNISKLEDWYKINRNFFYDNYGHGILERFNFSYYKMLAYMYPDFEWKEWCFKVSPCGFWKKSENIKKYVDWLSNVLKIKKPEDWYNVSTLDFYNNNGTNLIKIKRSIYNIVSEYIPDFHWNKSKFIKTSKTQIKIYDIISSKYDESLFNHKHKLLRSSVSNRLLELDIFIPSINLGIEYQGEQHFKPNKCWGGEVALKSLQERDLEKEKLCKKHAINLIKFNYYEEINEDIIFERIDKAIIDRDKKLIQ